MRLVGDLGGGDAVGPVVGACDVGEFCFQEQGKSVASGVRALLGSDHDQ
jgi:hypothetical protein